MSVSDFQSYDLTNKYISSALDIWAQPCTVYIPSSVRLEGYEDISPEGAASSTGVSGIGNVYTRINTKCFINFTPKKSVFYHFNWMPDDASELCTCVFPTNDVIGVGTYVRTSQVERASVWGDMFFSVVRVETDGLYRALNTTYFLRPVSDMQLRDLLSLGPSGDILSLTCGCV